MEKIIKGKPVADALTLLVKDEVGKLKENNILPKLKIVRVGEREDDKAYERAALKRMGSCGILYEVLVLPIDITQNEFIKELKSVNDDESVHGILLFRPLPKQISEDVVKYVIDPSKDIDCFNPVNVAKVMEGDVNGFEPCTAKAAMEMLKFYDVKLKGKKAAVVGRSMVVGRPVSLMLLKEDATVTICHSKTENLAEVTSQADIVIAAVGKSKMITSDFIKEGAVVIDVGINVDEEGNMSGDVNFDDCLNKASLISPVPAGVGSVTTAVLASHVLKACKLLTK